MSELAAGGAMLTCLAVVLGVVNFSKGEMRDVARANAAPAFAQTVSWVATEQQQERQPQFDAQSGPAAAIMPAIDLVEPLRGAVADPARLETVSASAPDPGVTPASAAHADAMILGIWAPDGSSCSLREFRQGLLPTIINAEGAWAGETFCSFKNHQQTDSGWRVVANCSNSTEHWTTQVRLSVKGDRLIWASKRGTQVYTRCGQDFLMARAR